MNRNMTQKIKQEAFDLGADLVGIASVERFEHAPLMMSPQGLMPGAKNVIVMAIHHPDAAMELGGEQHPQMIGPYSIQYIMNSKLDYIAIRIAKKIESLGYDSIPIASSNIWRYRGFMDLTADFAPDISHIYAAVCAGLTQIGWQGLSMSPEYGPWNRFISVITDAPLCETPMYEDIKLCDMCGECIKHCPTDAFHKEVNGIKEIMVGDISYKFPNKNLWRCAWGEHFDLDLDLEIPDVVNEEVILKTVAEYGKRGGEMGCCIKYCLPPHLRQEKEGFTSTYIRKKHSYASDLPVHRRLYDEACFVAQKYAVDKIAFIDEKTLKKSGIDYLGQFSPAKGAVVYSIEIDKPEEGFGSGANHGRGKKLYDSGILPYETALGMYSGFADLDITRLFENSGFQALNSVLEPEKYALAAGFDLTENNRKRFFGAVLTSAALKSMVFKDLQKPMDNPRKSMTENMASEMLDGFVDCYSIVPALRMEKLADKLRSIKGKEEIFLVNDKNPTFTPYDPDVSTMQREIYGPKDYILDAESVIVFGLNFPEKVSEMALKPPAYSVGPYVFSTYQTNFELAFRGLLLCKYLDKKGFKAVMTADLTGIGGDIGSPRGLLFDAFSNSIEAVEAGLGHLGVNGICYTKDHGMNQRFMAVITDAPLDEILKGNSSSFDPDFCSSCKKCVEACPAGALLWENIIEIKLNNIIYKWMPGISNRCDWAKKYALCAEEGHKYTGSKTDVAVPESVNEENLKEALEKSDEVFKFRPTTAQRCIIDCPLKMGIR